MPTFTSPVDGASIFYRYHQPDENAFRKSDRKTSDLTLVWLHGWPMSSRMYEHLIVPLCETYRFRCIAPDRRGFGKSEWNTPKTGTIGYDTFVADLAALLEHLDVKNFLLLGASMGSSEGLLTYLKSSFVQANCRVRNASHSPNLKSRLTVSPQGFIWMGPNMPFPVQVCLSQSSHGEN